MIIQPDFYGALTPNFCSANGFSHSFTSNITGNIIRVAYSRDLSTVRLCLAALDRADEEIICAIKGYMTPSDDLFVLAVHGKELFEIVHENHFVHNRLMAQNDGKEMLTILPTTVKSFVFRRQSQMLGCFHRLALGLPPRGEFDTEIKAACAAVAARNKCSNKMN